MLAEVGGLLGRVGTIVRSCHERWDGAGYPDGLAGEAIPLVARVVFCCDAFHAMTTDRSYRAARSPERALAELQANAGQPVRPDRGRGARRGRSSARAPAAAGASSGPPTGRRRQLGASHTELPPVSSDEGLLGLRPDGTIHSLNSDRRAPARLERGAGDRPPHARSRAPLLPERHALPERRIADRGGAARGQRAPGRGRRVLAQRWRAARHPLLAAAGDRARRCRGLAAPVQAARGAQPCRGGAAAGGGAVPQPRPQPAAVERAAVRPRAAAARRGGRDPAASRPGLRGAQRASAGAACCSPHAWEQLEQWARAALRGERHDIRYASDDGRPLLPHHVRSRPRRPGSGAGRASPSQRTSRRAATRPSA